jgi:predicted esterase
VPKCLIKQNLKIKSIIDVFTLRNNIKSDYLPTFHIHAKNDHFVDLQHANDLYNYLTEKNFKSELYHEKNRHSNALIEQNPEVIDKIINF